MSLLGTLHHGKWQLDRWTEPRRYCGIHAYQFPQTLPDLSFFHGVDVGGRPEFSWLGGRPQSGRHMESQLHDRKWADHRIHAQAQTGWRQTEWGGHWAQW